eukprot:15453177-Alexandrium_andersonii.AAC.1
MQGRMLDTLRVHLGEFNTCRQPECRHVSRKEMWVANTGTRGPAVACPRRGEPFRPERAFRIGRNAPYNKVLLFHADEHGRPYQRDAQGLIHQGQALAYPVWWDDVSFHDAAIAFQGIVHE